MLNIRYGVRIDFFMVEEGFYGSFELLGFDEELPFDTIGKSIWS
jgi:hypothetical protein